MNICSLLTISVVPLLFALHRLIERCEFGNRIVDVNANYEVIDDIRMQTLFIYVSELEQVSEHNGDYGIVSCGCSCLSYHSHITCAIDI